MENGRVVKLSLEDVGLTGAVPAEVGRLTALRELNVSRNALTLLPAEIGQLASLVKLSLSENQLTSVPAEIGQLASLQELWLNDNLLTSVPAEIRKLRAAGCRVELDDGVTVGERSRTSQHRRDAR